MQSRATEEQGKLLCLTSLELPDYCVRRDAATKQPKPLSQTVVKLPAN